MKIALLGYGSQNQSALEYWNDGNDLTICDQVANLTVPKGVDTHLGPDYLQDLDHFDLLVRSPSVHPRDIVAANPDKPDILNKVTSSTNEFFKVCPSRNIIGVTGTKGKGTTSTLITRLLEAAGKTVHLGGNIGIPPLDMLKNSIQSTDWVVLELANFQLIDLRYSPVTAVCLMVAPEHLDWHTDMQEYLEAKQQLFRYQTVNDTVIFNRIDAESRKVTGVSPAKQISYEVPPAGQKPLNTVGAYVQDDTIYMDKVPVCSVKDVALLGRHNLENICAAVGTTWDLIGKNPAIDKQVARSFTGLEHRLELVRELKGVKYYDDSFGTNPDTAIVAVQAFAEPKVLILGGSDKKASFQALAEAVAKHDVRCVVLIGETGPQIEQDLRAAGYNTIVAGGTAMSQIVQTAQAQARPGDIVLLSTACASFDLFANYKERGEQFKQAVLALPTDA